MTEERRLVTVLFADVVGSTAMGEELDPEDVRALLARLFAIARDAVERHGGRLEKFIGDAIMAIFGLPIAHDDDAARALSAALDLRDRVRDDPALGERLAIRLGVNGGEVIATRDRDAQEFLVTGDPVNTAARLQQAAEPWAILVGERTVRTVGDRFEFGSPVEILAKGKANPMVARPLQGFAPTTSGRARSHRLVGRDADLIQLELTARRAFEERRPYMVNIVAPAGVGKSRLLEEFLDRLEPGVRVALAQCLPYGQRLTYWPMRAILLSIVGLGDEANPEEVRDALVTWLREGSDPEPDRTAGLLASTIGASEGESGDRIALFGAWRRFVELAAERSPLVLVIEDLHWSSDSLLDLVEAILQPRADVPLLMIALARPELLDRRPSWGGGRRNAVSIALEPLAESAVATLVADLLESPAAEIVAAVVDRAEGNPFYAGEIVRSLVDRLGAAPEAASVSAAIAALPDTVQGTVLARLDALDPAARRLVQLGAVLGRAFQPRAIPFLEPDLADQVLEAAVDALVERDLVRPSGPGAMTFRHILIREVAYGTLPRAERARLHAAAGTWLEGEAVGSGREDELAELVAFHLREAVVLGSLLGESLPPDLSTRAVSWLRRAAEVAGEAAASVEAARHLQAAIALAPPEASAELYEALGDAWITGDQAVEAYERAYTLGGEFGLGADQQLRTLAQKTIVETRWLGSVTRRYEDRELRTFVGELAEMDRTASDERSRGMGLLAQAFLPGAMESRDQADVDGGRRAADRALELGTRLGDVDLQSAALDALSVTALDDDRAISVLGYVRKRLELPGIAAAERLDALNMTAWANLLLGDLHVSERAAAQVREGLAAGQASGYVMGAGAWRTEALWTLGRWDDALVEAGRSERAWHESEIYAAGFAVNGFLAALSICEARRDAVGSDRWRSNAETILGRTSSASRIQRLRAFIRNDFAELSERVIADHRAFFGRLDYVHRAIERVVDRRFPIPEPVLRELLVYTAERELRVLHAHAGRGLGILYGDLAELQSALTAFEAMGARPFVARAQAELGIRTGDGDLLEAGVAELERLGDVDHLARVIAEAAAVGMPAIR